jgi:FkbM family methyltransferase
MMVIDQRIVSGACTPRRFLDLADELASTAPIDPASTMSGRTIEPIVLYGAGELGELTIAALRRAGVSPVCVVDQKWDQVVPPPSMWHGVQAAKLSELPDDRGEMTLVTAISRYPMSAVQESNRSVFSGWKMVISAYDALEHYYPRQPIHNGWTTASWGATEWATFRKIGGILSDDCSRGHFLTALAWRHLRQEWRFTEHPRGDHGNGTLYRSMLTEQTLGTARSIADVGSFRGAFLETVRDAAGRWPCEYHGFEPDVDSHGRLVSRLATMQAPPSIQVRPEAVSRQEGSLRFVSGLGYASQVTDYPDSNAQWVDALSIDSLGLELDLIKIHSESSDLPALLGAADTIQASDTSVLATVYHSSEAFLGVFDHLAQLAGRQLFVRQGGFLGCGVVAISIAG